MDRRETCRNIRSKICLSIFSKPIIEGSLEVKLPTIWTDEKQRWEKSEKRREKERRSKKRKSQKKEDPGARKGRKVAKHCVFPLIRCGAKHVSKSKCTKHTMFGPLLEVFQVKMYKTAQCRTAFGSRHVEKVRGVVARSTLRSQKCKKLTGSEHFWKLRCRKSACRCGANGRSDVVLRGKRKGFSTLPKVRKNVRVLWHFQKQWRAWEICRGLAKMFRMAGAVQETCSSEML